MTPQPPPSGYKSSRASAISQLALSKSLFILMTLGESQNISKVEAIEPRRNSSVLRDDHRISFGIEGYRVPNTSRIFFQKPRAYRITEGKNEESYITQALRDKKDVPSPVLYCPPQDQSGMIFKRNLSIYKMKRSTFYEELSKRSKHSTPGVGAYNHRDGMDPKYMKNAYKR